MNLKDIGNTSATPAAWRQDRTMGESEESRGKEEAEEQESRTEEGRKGGDAGMAT